MSETPRRSAFTAKTVADCRNSLSDSSTESCCGPRVLPVGPSCPTPVCCSIGKVPSAVALDCLPAGRWPARRPAGRQAQRAPAGAEPAVPFAASSTTAGRVPASACNTGGSRTGQQTRAVCHVEGWKIRLCSSAENRSALAKRTTSVCRAGSTYRRM